MAKISTPGLNRAPAAVGRIEAGGSDRGAGQPSSFPKMTIYDIGRGFRNKRVLIRCDFNGAVKDGKVVPAARIVAALETIRYVLEQGATQIILLSHHGRYEEIKDHKGYFSLRPMRDELAVQLNEAVNFAPGFDDPISSAARVVLAENTRFDARDEKHKDKEGSRAYAQKILVACQPDIYVLDGFSVAHRAQASVTGLADLMRGERKLAVAGQLMMREYEFFIDKVISNPEYPFLVILGGAKVGGEGGKLSILQALLPKVDQIVLGGAMVFPFMLARGMKVESMDPFDAKEGRAEALKQEVALAREVLARPEAVKIIIPKTVVGPRSIAQPSGDRVVINLDTTTLPPDFVMRDVLLGEVTARLAALNPRTVFFNGALGAFETEQGGFVDGTYQVLAFMAHLTAQGVLTIPGGGDTMTALKNFRETPEGRDSRFGFETMGGGASGDLLAKGFAGKVEAFPGFGCLSNRG